MAIWGFDTFEAPPLFLKTDKPLRVAIACFSLLFNAISTSFTISFSDGEFALNINCNLRCNIALAPVLDRFFELELEPMSIEFSEETEEALLVY